MRIFFLFFVVFFLSYSVRAQIDSSHTKTLDSSKMAQMRAQAIEQASILNPRLRQFFVVHEMQGKSDLTTQTKSGTEVSNGTMRIERTRVNMNVPILQRGKNTLMSSLGFVNQVFHTETFQGNNIASSTQSMQMLNAGLTYIRQGKLFGKDVTFAGIVNGMFDTQFDRAQLSVVGMANITLKRTATTSMSVGAVFMYDPSSPSPFIPMFNYYHRFTSAKLDFIFDAPYRLALRKEFSSKFSLAFSNDMIGYNSFFEQDQSSITLPKKLIFSYLEVKSGLLAEYRLSKKAFLSLSSGVNMPLKSRILDNYAKPNDYLIKNKLNPVPYVQIGFSLLPFWKGLNL